MKRAGALVAFDVANTALAVGLGVSLVSRLVGDAADASAGWVGACAAGALLGYLCADVASGVVHWACDSYFHPTTPIVGATLIAPFRDHHADPDGIARHGVFERNGNNCLAALPWLVLALGAPWNTQTAFGGAAHVGLVVFALTLCFTNQIHAWAHASTRPSPVRWLQRHRLLLTPESHAAHHDGTHRRAYAIVCGWSHHWLDHVLALAERALARLGAEPTVERTEALR